MSSKFIGLAVTGIIFLQFSCLKSKTECSFAPCQFVAPTAEVQALSAYISSNSITAAQHCSGMFYTINSAGTGKTPDGCSLVSVKYTGRLVSGFIFDQQIGTPVAINLNQVITAWRSGISLMKEGGSVTLYVPPSLGYGSQDVRDGSGNIVIPANSILIFDVQLSSVQ